MVYSFCKAENFQQITQIGEDRYLVRFTMKPLMQEKYADGEPTGEMEESGYVTFTEAHIKGELIPEKLIPLRLEEADMYDQSDNVNSLFVNGKRMWFDKITRACIAYSMQTEKASGATETVLYDNDNVPYTLPVDNALQLFGALELYAKACYNTTARHKAEVAELTTVQELLDYDITAGYPEKLNITLSE